MKIEERVYTEAEVQQLRSALNWIIGFCESVEKHHTGFTHIKRRALDAMSSEFLRAASNTGTEQK